MAGKTVTDTLRLGDPAPAFDLGAANREGNVSLAQLLAKGPAIIEFLRGTWCPHCVQRMKLFEPVKADLANTGTLVFVAAEKRGGMFKPEEFLEKHPISYPFLLDEDRAVTKDYGVYHPFGIDAINIAHPATLVIGRDGAVRYIYVGSSQMDRAPLDGVLGALKSG